MVTSGPARGGRVVVAAIVIVALDAAEADVASSPQWRLQAGYTADLFANVRGGLRRDSAYLQRIDVLAELESAGFAEGHSITAFGNLIQTNDTTFSEPIVGDTQVVSNIDAPGGVRMLEAWLQYAFASGASVKLGLYDLNSEFDYIETGSFFINSSHGIGPEVSQSGENGPSIFPVTGLAARVEIPTSDRSRLRLAVLDGVPGAPDDPDRTSLHLSSDEGALLIAESDWMLSERWRAFGAVWAYTEEFPVLDASESSKRSEAWGAYVGIDGRVDEQFSAWLRLGHASPAVHQFEAYLGAGLLWEDPDVVPWLTFGAAAGWARTSTSFRDASSLAGELPAGREFNLELSVRLQINDWLALQPDLQWIRHPGGRADIEDAWVVGLRLEVALDLASD